MNMFTSAPVLPAKSASKGKKDVLTKEVKGVELLAALRAVETNVKAQIAVAEAGVKSLMTEHFVDEGMRIKRRPENYKGTDNGSEASLQLKCMSSASAVSEDAQALLAEHEIPLEKAVSQHATFMINPAYADLSVERNADMLAKVSDALAALGLPVDFFLRQEEVSKQIATADSIDAVMALKNKSDVAMLLPLVSCLAVKAVLAENANPFQIVDAALGEPEIEQAA